jgi:formate dehydrogenase alpha subunit
VIDLTIDGIPTQVEENTTILEAAERIGVYIPTFCYHAKLGPFGACRICMVQIDPGNRLVPACITKAMRNMVVNTKSERVIEARKTNLELLLARHPTDCLVCERGGECELQQVCFKLGVTSGIDQSLNRLVEIFGVQPPDLAMEDTRTIIARNLSKCIMCKRCIRICHEVQALGAIQFSRRGFKMEMGTFFGQELTCEFCGQCVDICPVGALTHQMSKYKARLWQMDKVPTICSYCSVGCSLCLNIKDNEIIKVNAENGKGVNDGNLCYKGRYGQIFVNEPQRLTTPLIRDNSSGKLVQVGWDEALNLVAKRLSQIKADAGADSIAGLGSARCTNEDNYLFQKLMRCVIGTNNLDNCTRFEHAPSLVALDEALGWPAMSNSFADIASSPLIFLVGANPTETHPVFGIKLRRAAKEGKTKLIVLDPRRTKLSKYAKAWLPVRPGTDVALIWGMIYLLIKEHLIDEEFIEKFTVGFEEVRQAAKKFTPAYTSKITGISEAQLHEITHLYGKAKSAAIIYGMGATQHTWGTDLVYSLVNLALISGNLGKAGGGLNPLRGQSNTQGVCDMGVLPDFFPGYQHIPDPWAISKLEKHWGKKIPRQPGLTLTQMIPAITEGKLRAMYIMGENPVLSSPNPKQTQQDLTKLDFLVVQDIFHNQVTEVANVVLPGSSFAEKDGTFTNSERRIQRLHKAIQPIGESRPDWLIISQLADYLGYKMDYSSPAQIMKEITQLVPVYEGINYSRLETRGIQWPCFTEEHPGTPILYQDGFPQGKAKLTPIEYKPIPTLTTKEYPYLLVTGKYLFHYHSGMLNKRAENLIGVPEQGIIEINPQNAEEIGISDGSEVVVTSDAGQIELIAKLSDDSPEGTLFMPVHFGHADANSLFKTYIDYISHIPELKHCAVNIKPKP